MASMHVDYTAMEWTSGVPFYGAAAVYGGKDVVQLKVLSDRRGKAAASPGSSNYAAARQADQDRRHGVSDEHVFSLQGGRSTKSGQRAQGSGGYGLNPKGQPHSAMIAAETMALVIYAGEPDEIKSMEIVDVEPAGSLKSAVPIAP